MTSKWMNRLAAIAIATLVAACGGGAQQESSSSTTAKPEEAKKPAAAAPAPAEAGAASDYSVAPVTGGGKVTGKVTVTGNIPAPEEIDVTKDNATCGTKKTLVTVKAGKGGELANAVVWLEGVKSGKDWSNKNGGTIDQKTCEYTPQVQVLPAGANLSILNSDPVLHNIHAYDAAGETLFNMAQPTQGQKNDKKLAKSGPVEFKCDVHNWMHSWIFVAPNPYYAVTGDDGSFSIDDVPPGSYKAHVWQGALGSKDMDVTVAAGAAATANFALEAK